MSVGDISQLITAVLAVLGAVTGGVAWFKRWVRKQIAEPVRGLHEQLGPNGGNQETTRHLVEQIAAGMTELQSQVSDNRRLATEALSISNQALGVANGTASQLAAHLREREN